MNINLITAFVVFFPVILTFNVCGGESWQHTAYLNFFVGRRSCQIDSTLDFSESLLSDSNAANDSAQSAETTDAAPTADLATFDEWKQKILSAENDSDQANSAQKDNVVKVNVANKKPPHNFASVDCGARIVASNPESTNSHAILTASTDEYMNNPCSAARKFVVVELCDSVSISEIEVGNLELFSSLPKFFNISISERFPVKEWFHLGRFTAKEERQLTSFRITEFLASSNGIKPMMYSKFVKIELMEHYGAEHYCPITSVRVFGVGLLDDDIEDDIQYGEGASIGGESGADAGADEGKPPNSLFNAAKKTVMRIVQQVLPPKTAQNETVDPSNETLSDQKHRSVHYGNVMRPLAALDPCLHCNKSCSRADQWDDSQLCLYFRLTTDYQVGSIFSTATLSEGDDSAAGLPEKDELKVLTNVSNSATEEVKPTNGEVAKDVSENSDLPTSEPEKPPENGGSGNGASPADGTKASGNSSPVEEQQSTPKAEKVQTTTKDSTGMAEKVIMDKLMPIVDGIEDDDGSIGGMASAKPTVKENKGKSVRGTTVKSASANKQPLVRFVGRVRELETWVRELERNLSLTSRYLEELSLNYRKRLDEMKVKVDSLANLSTAQAMEIERLTDLLNKTNLYFENTVMASNQTMIQAAVPFGSLMITIVCFFTFTFICIYRHRPAKTQQTGNDTMPSPVSQLKRVISPQLNRFDNSVMSAPVSPKHPKIMENGLSRRLSLDVQQGSDCYPSTQTNCHDQNGVVRSLDSGFSESASLVPPLVVPTNLSQSFLLSPFEDNKRRHRKRHRHKGGNSNDDSNGSNGSAKSMSPYRRSAEK